MPAVKGSIGKSNKQKKKSVSTAPYMSVPHLKGAIFCTCVGLRGAWPQGGSDFGWEGGTPLVDVCLIGVPAANQQGDGPDGGHGGHAYY